jgi:DNA-directed RNA polymerase specialized sigma24 family protein
MDEQILDFLAWRSEKLETVRETDDALDLYGAMDLLPADEFVVFWMYAIESHTFNVIAATLGISTSTAHARMRRAVVRMRKHAER